MSIIPPGLSRSLPFYLSGPGPCPYLSGRVERKLFTRLGEDDDFNDTINDTLTRAGFRRSHEIIYRPACTECSACVPVRVPVMDFKPDETQRRIQRRNRDLYLTEIPQGDLFTEALMLYPMFRAYQLARHPDSDMARMSPEDYLTMLASGVSGTRLFVLCDGRDEVRAAALCDLVSDGVSAVYSFFDTETPNRSLGTMMIMALIDEMKKRRQDHVYLGYWIEASGKMAYKSTFKPLQKLGQDGWQFFDHITIRNNL